MFYEVNETQIIETNPVALSPRFFTSKEEAESAYYTILASAAISTIPYHSACIIRSDGVMIEGKVYDRRNPISEE